MTRARAATAALVAAVAILVAVSLPPRRLTPAGPGDDALRGVLHVHTNRSDGRSAPDAIAAIAARAGLQFVVFTDHGDATRKPDPPAYRSGVLCLDAVEISTDAGHLLALGLPAAPYPLAGEARDVVDDVHRLGGVAIAAHPDSPKDDLRWRDWTVPLDGVELLNLDTSWRVRAQRTGWAARAALGRALAGYFVRPSETIASLLTDSEALAGRWAALAAVRPVSIVAGVDAHARLELRESDPGDNRFTLALPGYEAVFGALTMRVRPERPLSGDAQRDARLVLEALKAGRGYAAVDGILAPPAFEFAGRAGDERAVSGGSLGADGAGELTVRTNAPPTFTTTLWRDGEVLASRSTTPELTLDVPAGAAVYRAEVRATDRPGAPLWVLSNPIYRRGRGAAGPPEARPAPTPPPPGSAPGPGTPGRTLFDQRTSEGWRVEVASESKAASEVVPAADGRELSLRYGLPGGDAFGQYAAAVVDTTGGLRAYRSLTVTARAGQPMRLSIQLRVPLGDTAGERWQRSMYLDEAGTTVTIPLDDFRPVGVTRTPRAPLEQVHALLFIVDRTNTKPGSSGRFWLKRVTLQ